MAIPNADQARVPDGKIGGYLLNLNHPNGGSKARWFLGLGYQTTAPEVLEYDLLRLVRDSNDFDEQGSPYGVKYVVRGVLTTPGARTVAVQTVWIIEPTDPRPRLVTAYPGDEP